jgi:hypothetical protein
MNVGALVSAVTATNAAVIFDRASIEEIEEEEREEEKKEDED